MAQSSEPGAWPALEVIAGPTRLTPPPICQGLNFCAWRLTREELGDAPLWIVNLCGPLRTPASEVLRPQPRVLAARDVPRRAKRSRRRAGLMRMQKLDVRAHALQGSRPTAEETIATDVAYLEAKGALDLSLTDPLPEELAFHLRVEDPNGLSWRVPAELVRRRTRWGIKARVAARNENNTFPAGTWTLSLNQNGKGLVRRVRLALAQTPFRVKECSALLLSNGQATRLRGILDTHDPHAKLVLAFRLEGQRVGVIGDAHLTLRDRRGAPLGSWRREIDRSDRAALERLCFAVSVARLQEAQGAIHADLILDGVHSHHQKVALYQARFRGDGVLLEGPTEFDPDRAAEGLAFFSTGSE
jgi:hypothetical protein